MIYNKLVLNLRADDNSVSVIKLNPPYNLMVDLEKIPFGWDFKDHVRNLFEDYEWLKDFNSELAKLILEKNSMSLKAMA